MKKIKITPSHTDSRGVIADILENRIVNAITEITFETGAVRANHYHKQTTQWNYVISGKILIRTQMIGGNEEVQETVIEPGELVETVPNEIHALKALEPSKLLVFTEGPRGGKEYESDTFRLDVPLIPASE